MKLEECFKKIDNYLNSSSTMPRLVNLQNIKDIKEFIKRYDIGSNLFLPISNYCKPDRKPQLDRLENDLITKSDNIFITGLASYLKLEGEHFLKQKLNQFVTQSVSGHLVIVCYQCEEYLHFSDSRIAQFIYKVEGEKRELPTIVFTSITVQNGQEQIEGIDKLPFALESTTADTIYVKTDKSKEIFKDSLFLIKQQDKAFDALCHIDIDTNCLENEFGTEEQWNYALEKVTKAHSWKALITQEFDSNNHLDGKIASWGLYNDNKRWLYFIALKMIGVKNNWCLSYAISKSSNEKEFIHNIYRSLLSLNHTEKQYWEKYEERKKILSIIGNFEEEILDYTKRVHLKQKYALYYLTDTNKLEKQKILELLDKYASEFSREEIIKILEHIYKDIAQYLTPYRFENELLTNYFYEYRYQKVINKIYPEFLALVEEQAKRRDFNLILPPRTEKLEQLDKKAKLYFIDAMGVEYLAFIISKCKQYHLIADITVCHCELPSITRFNKEFLNVFSPEHIALDIKRLDNIKHHGEESFDYRKTKLPLHLIQELEIIEEVIIDIRKKIAGGEFEKAYLISDHGSSRLAVIQESECQWEMVSKGQHSGRCCPANEIDLQFEYATLENDFWVLANYDRFKGGRQANVEVHGGATLEEVTIPIIELTAIKEKIEIEICTPLPIIASYKKKAEIQLFSKTKLKNVSVCVKSDTIRSFREQYYDTVTEDNQMFTVSMPDVKRAGQYTLDIYSNNNLIASKLEFSVKKEGVSEKDLL